MVASYFRSILKGFMAAGLVVLIHGCAPQKTDDCGYVQNAYGQRISWKKPSYIDLYINSNVPVVLKPALYRAISTWEENLGRKIFNVIEENNSKDKNPRRDKKNAIYFLSEWESDRKTEQGRTSVYWAGDQIQEADIRINGHHFAYYDQDPKELYRSSIKLINSDGYSFEALILHELGHFLGLKHRENEGTVMATFLSAFNDRVKLSSVDNDALKCEY